MDTSAFLDPGKTKLYQSLIGALTLELLQGLVTLKESNKSMGIFQDESSKAQSQNRGAGLLRPSKL
eukprot:scaffold3119_cov92-Amphora_coffeaeformis.AAC.1